ncbi:inhibitor of growth protein 4-like [Aphis craccivora]|uniref:Inhibitor of growth protein n=1 Tax=Aphis craccivora TaxID=307492 RepID=A0A6G0ZAL8_APHCR|nr:inhibitor of growth protein 4-like [Aphis craccivora]
MKRLENLPAELQQNLTLMREIDSRAQKVIGDIGKQTDDYFKSKAYLTDKNKKKMNRIQGQFDKAKAYSDDKVQLAIQTYALVDEQIKKLDVYLARSSEQFEDTASNATLNMEGGSQNKKLQRANNKGHSVQTFDMPVDPNEPKYCLCKQVSYGDMISCDNPDVSICSIEWFHFGCVKLPTNSKKKWFCPNCKKTDKKKLAIFKRK